MLVADIFFSLFTSVMTFVLTGLLQIPITLISRAFGV